MRRGHISKHEMMSNELRTAQFALHHYSKLQGIKTKANFLGHGTKLPLISMTRLTFLLMYDALCLLNIIYILRGLLFQLIGLASVGWCSLVVVDMTKL